MHDSIAVKFDGVMLTPQGAMSPHVKDAICEMIDVNWGQPGVNGVCRCSAHGPPLEPMLTPLRRGSFFALRMVVGLSMLIWLNDEDQEAKGCHGGKEKTPAVKHTGPP